MANTSILFVDDDEKILNGILRQQGDDFDISIAVGPMEALELVESEGPFAVVVSDMRMPEMNGIQLLKRIREMSPNTVRMILTGYAELNTTIEAVNEGHIFRFLAKPCSEEDMAASLQAGLRQYALVEAEKELVEGTLHGSVNVLSEVLSLVNPLAFGQSTRIRSTVDGILKRFTIEDQWQLEIAAMLSSLGCVTLPPDLLQKKLDGHALTADEEEVFGNHPALASELIKTIPRLERVAEIISYLHVGERSTPIDRTEMPIESQILNLALDFDLQELGSESSLHAVGVLKENGDRYAPKLIEALQSYVQEERDFEFAELMVHEIREGMVLADDIRTDNGTLLMSKGQTITTSATRLLRNFSNNGSISGPFKVMLSKSNCQAVD